MPDSIREQVVQAFATRISAKRAEQISREDALPVRALWDFNETTERMSYGKNRMTLTISVGVMDRLPTGENASQRANAVLAELLEDALNADPTMGGLCQRLTYTDSTIDFPQPGQDVLAVLTEFEIVYETDTTSPYTNT